MNRKKMIMSVLLMITLIGTISILVHTQKSTTSNKAAGNQDSMDSIGATLSTESHKLSLDQMYADYDYMWDILYENYPYLNVVERVEHIDVNQIKNDYRAEIENVNKDAEFYDVLTNTINLFHYCGHIKVLTSEECQSIYQTHKRLKDDYPQINYLFQVLNQDAVRNFYGIETLDIESGTEEENKDSDSKSAISVAKKINNDTTAYLQISTFDRTNLDHDYSKLKEFYESIKDTTSLIINIKGNGGGSEEYWRKNIVSLLISDDITYDKVIFLKGKQTYDYFNLFTSVQPISECNPDSYPSLNSEDFKEMEYFQVSKNIIEKSIDSIEYKGDIYLLVDRAVYSSSEAFAYFCKSTGWATLIGEQTSGDGIGVDPLIIFLPNSGICLWFSTAYGVNADGTSNEEYGTTPDVACSSSKSLTECLKIINDKNR